MVDSVDNNVGKTRSTESAAATQGLQGQTAGQVAVAANNVGARAVEAQARKTAGGDGFDRVADGSAGLSGDKATKGPELKDGQWLHDPRQLTPGQAKELQDMLDKGNLHPDTQRDIREFLDDYKNNRDRLFPSDPNPLPRPYPYVDPNRNVG